ncbi:MAG: motility associated factor glycosyltransferase family protein [Deltaproteobacteria bacterium]|nr:motility associated factor glycosyltransferase family protein [Deltaproteobacteria bacterium]
MNQTFNTNIEALRKKNKALADALELSPAVEPVQIEKTKTGDDTFKYNGKYFHSSYDPWKEANQQVEAIIKSKFDWVFLFGMGCSYIPRLLMEKGKEKIIVYEPRLEILKSVLSTVDLKDVLSKDSFHLCHTLNNLGDTVRNHTEGMEDLLVYYTPPYKQAFSEELRAFTNRVQNAYITNKVLIKTEITSRVMWNDNYLANLKYFAKYRAIDALHGRFKDTPLVIVGAGPSLKKNARLLKDIKDKAVIIAAITAYKPLLNFGVIPHFLIASEKIDLAEYFTNGKEDKEIRLILGDLSHPNVFKSDVKGKFVFYDQYVNLSAEQMKLWGSCYFPSSGGSVTTTALDMGLMFGCNPIVFIGQDLSFSEGKGYTDGTVYKEKSIVIDKEKGLVKVDYDYMYLSGDVKYVQEHSVLWLKGLNEEWVASKYDWVTFHQWFENYMAWLKKEHPSEIVVNATEGGAYIEGMEHIKLIEAIEKYSINKETSIEDVISDVEKDKPKVDFAGLIDSFTKVKDAVKGIRISAKAINKETKIIDKIFKAKGMTHEFKKHTDRIKKLEKKLFDKSEDAAFLWEIVTNPTYQLKEYLRKELDEDMEKQFEKDLNIVAESYKCVIEACDMYLPKLDKAIEEIEEMQAEVKSETGRN